MNLYKKLYYLFLPVYLFLFLLAILFYKERTIFADAAYHLFSIIRYNGFAIQNTRFGAAATQIFPLVAARLSLPLSGVMMSYSIGFICFYFLCYFFCGVVLKDYRMGLVLLLSQLLFVSHTFYWIESELPQAIAFCMVVFAFINSRSDNWLKQPGSVVLMLFGVVVLGFFHPLLAFVFSYVALFLFFRTEETTERRTLKLAAILYATFFVIKAIVFRTPYDQHSMGGSKRLFTTFPYYFSIYSNKLFLSNCLTIYCWIPIISTIIAIVYVHKKNWKAVLMFAGYMISFLLLVNVSYPDQKTPEFYIENLYLPLGVFLALPLVYDILPLIKLKFAGILVLVIVLSALGRIGYLHERYTVRLNAERQMLDRHPDEKIVFNSRVVSKDTFMMVWGSSYEFWLLSTTEKYKTASLIILDTPAQAGYMFNDPRVFITNWGGAGYHELPKKYFIFKDTASTYWVGDSR